MKRKKIFLRFVVFLVLLYPATMLFKAVELLGVQDILQAEASVLDYQISTWISWILFAVVAVYYKWSEGSNSFFYFAYGFLLVAFGILGYLQQDLVRWYDLDTGFRDSYTFGVVVALKSIVTAFILTIALQAAVWWFTRRWHRR